MRPHLSLHLDSPTLLPFFFGTTSCYQELDSHLTLSGPLKNFYGYRPEVGSPSESINQTSPGSKKN